MSALAYMTLSRWHRPTGVWLLLAPCWIGIVFARIEDGVRASDLVLAVLFGLGAAAMRGAGCTYNDILDRRLDAQVERTRTRPLASGKIGVTAAIAWMLVQCLIGLAVVAVLPPMARWLAVCSLPLVALYPMMKRWTNWPQLWLGLTFNWGVLVAVAAVAGHIGWADIVLYLALACWTVGYDTIYALQDIADDRRVGIGSTAQLLGSRVATGVAVSYGLAVLGLIVAANMAGAHAGLWGVMPFAACLAWQVVQMNPAATDRAAFLFASNAPAAAVLVLAWGATGVAA